MILRVDGTSSFLTLKEHQRRGWKESARCDLSNRNLRGYSFAGANLEGAKLDGSDFSGCSFKAANLTDASARNCSFEGVDFTSARLRRADLSYSVLRKSIFCSLDGIFMAATIDCTNFAFCNLSDVRFVVTPPGSPTEFLSCRLKAADFSSSDLSRSNLRGIDFRTCRFMGANLFGTSLQRCNLEGVDLGSTNLVNANLAQVIFSDSSKFPNGFVLPLSTRNMDQVRRAEQRAAQELVRLTGKLLIGLTVVVMVAVIWRLPDWQHKAVSTPKSKSFTRSSDLMPPGDSVSVEDKPATAEPSNSTKQVVQQPIQELDRPKPMAQRPIEKANELYFSSRYAEAIEAYEHLITLNEKDPTPKMNLARLLATCPNGPISGRSESIEPRPGCPAKFRSMLEVDEHYRCSSCGSRRLSDSEALGRQCQKRAGLRPGYDRPHVGTLPSAAALPLVACLSDSRQMLLSTHANRSE